MDAVDLWNERMSQARQAWGDSFPDCGGGPIAKTGVAWTPISVDWAMRLMFLFWFSEPLVLHRDDHIEGYMAEPREDAIEGLNQVNEYHAVSIELMAALGAFTTEHVPWITGQIGHPWRVCSVRPFALRAGDDPGNKHFDGWAPAIRKLFILPAGASRQGGTTWFGLRDGSEMVLEHPDPCLLLFENSLVEHCTMPGEIYRPTLEIDIVPAHRTDPRPVYAGLNGWFPWAPKETACAAN